MVRRQRLAACVIRVDTNEVRMLAGRYDLDYIDGGDARSLTRVIGLKGASAPAS